MKEKDSDFLLSEIDNAERSLKTVIHEAMEELREAVKLTLEGDKE